LGSAGSQALPVRLNVAAAPEIFHDRFLSHRSVTHNIWPRAARPYLKSWWGVGLGVGVGVLCSRNRGSMQRNDVERRGFPPTKLLIKIPESRARGGAVEGNRKVAGSILNGVI
jgi:hypothetical protein